MSDGWPLAGLRLRIGDLDLHPPDLADRDELAGRFPADVELDPDSPRFPGLDAVAERELRVRQVFWRAAGTWSVTAWELHLAVRAGGELVGEQVLEAEDFPTHRTVDSHSWLLPGVRGRGVGRTMRRAVLALAFGPLEARAAVSSAWHDNHASLGVSRALGYRPDGEHPHPRGQGTDTMVHVRLARAQWLASGLADDVVVEGFGPARVMFGL